MATSLHKNLADSELHEAKGAAGASADQVLTAVGDGTATFQDLPALASHASTHEDGGADEISVAGLSGQLADDQPALAHDLGGSKHNSDTLANLNSKISDATLDDSSSARTPTAHATTHQDGGADEISVAGLSGTLADEQDAGSIKGVTVDDTDIANGRILKYNLTSGNLEYEDEGGTGAIFGTQYQQEESSGESSTTSSTFQDKLSLTTPTVPAGTYRVGWTAMFSNVDKPGEARLYNSTDTVMLGGLKQYRPKTSDIYQTITDFVEVTFSSSGSKTFIVQWRDVLSGNTQYIKEARIEFWRLS